MHPLPQGERVKKAHPFLLVLLLTLFPTMALADTVQLYAAGSLRGALTDVAKAFEAKTGDKVVAKFGASGLLKDEIAGGAAAQVFASANMEHPQALHDDGKSGPVVRFARNKMCALANPLLKVDDTNLLARMLDPLVKLGISTPKADPSGDYAIDIFRKAEAIKPGARAELEKKARLLTGSATSAAPPAGRLVYGWLIAEGKADIFLTYCTNALRRAEAEPRPTDHRTAGQPQRRRRLRPDGDRRRAARSAKLRQFHRLAGRRGDPFRATASRPGN